MIDLRLSAVVAVDLATGDRTIFADGTWVAARCLAPLKVSATEDLYSD